MRRYAAFEKVVGQVCASARSSRELLPAIEADTGEEKESKIVANRERRKDAFYMTRGKLWRTLAAIASKVKPIFRA